MQKAHPRSPRRWLRHGVKACLPMVNNDKASCCAFRSPRIGVQSHALSVLNIGLRGRISKTGAQASWPNACPGELSFGRTMPSWLGDLKIEVGLAPHPGAFHRI